MKTVTSKSPLQTSYNCFTNRCFFVFFLIDENKSLTSDAENLYKDVNVKIMFKNGSLFHSCYWLCF